MHCCISFISHLQMTLLIILSVVLKKLLIIKNQHFNEVIGGIQKLKYLSKSRWKVECRQENKPWCFIVDSLHLLLRKPCALRSGQFSPLWVTNPVFSSSLSLMHNRGFLSPLNASLPNSRSLAHLFEWREERNGVGIWNWKRTL